MGATKKGILNIEVNYERVGDVYDHMEHPKEHKCITCGKPSISEFCSAQCHEFRFF